MRSRYFAHLRLAVAATALVASGAGAQQAQHHGTPVLDLTMARHTISGGFVDYRTGASLDLLIAGEVHSAPRRTLIIAGGGGAVLGGFGDRCLIRPGGGCAEQANFVVVNALVGTDVPLGPFAGRALIGPALYNGAGDTSLGAQGRIDVSSPTFAHLGLGVMLRATVLPSHNGQRLLAWALGGSVIVR